MLTNYEALKNEAWTFMDLHSYDNAYFIAELLNCRFPSEDHLLLLATCHFRKGKYQVVKSLFEKQPEIKSLRLRILYSESCIKLQRYVDAERVFIQSGIRAKPVPDVIKYVKLCFKEYASYALKILATIYTETDRIKGAEKFLKEVLKLNPLMFTAFQELCKISKPKNKPNPDDFFNVNVLNNLESESLKELGVVTTSTPQSADDTHFKKKKICTKVLTPILDQNKDNNKTQWNVESKYLTPVQGAVEEKFSMRPIEFTPSSNDSSRYCKSGWDTTVETTGTDNQSMSYVRSTHKKITKNLRMAASASFSADMSGMMPLPETPVGVNVGVVYPSGMTTPTDIIPIPMPALAPKRGMLTRQSYRKATAKLMFNSSSTNSPRGSTEQQQAVIATRKSSRISANSNNVSGSLKENTKKGNRQKLSYSRDTALVKRPLKRKLKTDVINNATDMTTPFAGRNLRPITVAPTMNVIHRLAHAQVAMSQYKCSDAITHLQLLPLEYRESPFVLLMIAQAHFESNAHKEARKVFEEIRSRYPHRVTGMAMYSSCLWRLKDLYSLSLLGDELFDMDPNSPEVLCVLGNCFSQKSHTKASIKCLLRAVQVDPSFGYAYFLLGQEYSAIGDNERAVAAYENGMRVEPNSYNSWYGMGEILFRQQNYRNAEHYFNEAININGYNSILYCQKGRTLKVRKRYKQSVATLEQALSIEPGSVQCMFQLANSLYTMQRFEAALEQLLKLKKLIPTESVVFFMLGKIYAERNDTQQATLNFSRAHELDPKGDHTELRKAIDDKVEQEPSYDHGNSSNVSDY